MLTQKIVQNITGKVKWFNDSKGYGFIHAEKYDFDIFAHYTAINTTGFKTLAEDQEVIFDMNELHKGPATALNIRKVIA